MGQNFRTPCYTFTIVITEASGKFQVLPNSFSLSLSLSLSLSVSLLCCCTGGECEGLSSSGLSPWRQHDPRQ